ncbi:MAG: hypothetical protein K8J09_04970, partial [Planctomycetes bacterium]|nr:hypothetical protein [Planctomycetota bacterium]
MGLGETVEVDERAGPIVGLPGRAPGADEPLRGEGLEVDVVLARPVALDLLHQRLEPGLLMRQQERPGHRGRQRREHHRQRQMAQPRPGGHQHAEQRRHEEARRAQVGLQRDEADGDQRQHARREEGQEPLRRLAAAQV